MKIFIYKSLLIFLFIFITFHLTFNYALRSIERKIDAIGSRENIEIFQNKIRGQIKESIQKDEILNKEDAILLRKFLEKVRSEIYKRN